MPRCDDGRYLVTTSSLFRPLHPLVPHRMFRWSAPPRIVVQVAQRRRRSDLPQRLVSVHATRNRSYSARLVQLGANAGAGFGASTLGHASHSRRRRKADMWRRSIDIRRALPGNARADPESRPKHSTQSPLREALRSAIRIRHIQASLQASTQTARPSHRWEKREATQAMLPRSSRKFTHGRTVRS